MLKTTTALAAMLALAACGGDPDADNGTAGPSGAETPAPAPAPTPTDAPSPTPTPSPTGDPEPGASLPQADAEFRYVGRWAAEAGMCGDPWIFAERRLETPAGMVCEFSDVEKVPGGYDIAATCTAEAPPAEDRLELRFAESARAMLVESEETLSPVGLVYCGG